MKKQIVLIVKMVAEIDTDDNKTDQICLGCSDLRYLKVNEFTTGPNKVTFKKIGEITEFETQSVRIDKFLL
jgi:hypothetical protein